LIRATAKCFAGFRKWHFAAFGMFRADPEGLPSTLVGQMAPRCRREKTARRVFPCRPAPDVAGTRGEVTLVNFWAARCPAVRASTRSCWICKPGAVDHRGQFSQRPRWWPAFNLSCRTMANPCSRAFCVWTRRAHRDQLGASLPRQRPLSSAGDGTVLVPLCGPSGGERL